MRIRLITWSFAVLLTVGVIVVVRRLQQADAASDGRITFKDQSGDLVQFFLSELPKFGSTLTTTSKPPVLGAEWRYAEDSKGFQVLVPHGHKEELVRCLALALGEPTLRDQYPHLVYKEDRFGVGIVADLQSDPIHIICLRRGSVP